MRCTPGLTHGYLRLHCHPCKGYPCLDLWPDPAERLPSLAGQFRALACLLFAGALVAALRTDALTAVFFYRLITFLAGDFVAWKKLSWRAPWSPLGASPLVAFLAGAFVSLPWRPLSPSGRCLLSLPSGCTGPHTRLTAGPSETLRARHNRFELRARAERRHRDVISPFTVSPHADFRATSSRAATLFEHTEPGNGDANAFVYRSTHNRVNDILDGGGRSS